MQNVSVGWRLCKRTPKLWHRCCSSSSPRIQRKPPMNTKIAAIALAAVLTQMAGCSRVDVTLEKPRQNESAPVVLAQNTSAPAPQSAAQRIVEIDRLLSAPLTGQSGDSDQRATLRAERAALTNPYAQTVARTQSAQIRQQPAAPRQNNSVVIAPNSQAHNLSPLEAMAPAERERHYRELRIKNPRPIVPYYSR
jgi:hypothetical protein